MIPDCRCGASARLVDRPKSSNETTLHFYGVECEGVECEGVKRHHTPLAFSTEKSAVKFWSERFSKG